MTTPAFVDLVGGPLDGDRRRCDDWLAWPPPLTLPGIFHGGQYLRRDVSERHHVDESGSEKRTFFSRVATYHWLTR